MTCEEFEAMGLDVERDTSLSDAQRIALRQHAASCSRCAALGDSWQRTHLELRALAEESAAAEAPARVEMRLRQEFRVHHHTPKARSIAVVTAWLLAAAAVLLGAVGWIQWRSNQRSGMLSHSNVSQTANTQANSGFVVSNPELAERSSDEDSQTLVADNELSNFTFLPGALPTDTEDAAILRVRMQRGALRTFGLPVNEDRAGEWIQVDLLVGNDGLPQAVRLHESP